VITSARKKRQNVTKNYKTTTKNLNNRKIAETKNFTAPTKRPIEWIFGGLADKKNV
jgi:hypothetical protein